LLIVLEVLCSVLLIGLVLLQKSKSEGLGLAFGGGTGEALFGSRTGNVLTKATIVLGIVFLANTLVLGMLYSGRQDKALMDRYANTGSMRPAQPGAVRPATEGSTRPAKTDETSTSKGVPTLPGVNLDAEPVAPEPTEIPDLQVSQPDSTGQDAVKEEAEAAQEEVPAQASPTIADPQDAAEEATQEAEMETPVAAEIEKEDQNQP
jgi:preprotein translocase subunit SecG